MTADTPRPPKSPHDREGAARRKAAYETVLRVVHHQTSPQQLPGASRKAILLTAADHGSWTRDAITSALQAATEQDDLFVWLDREGTRRYTRSESDALRRLAEYLDDTEMLHRLVGHVGGWDEPDRELVATINRRLDALRSDGGSDGGDQR